MGMKGRCILVGSAPMRKEEIEYREGDFLIAVDGGLTHLAERGITPDHVLGDYDSLPERCRPLLERFEAAHPGSVTTLPVVKDDTDTIAAARLGFEMGFREFLIYGGLGGDRLDHTLANIQTLVYLKKLGAGAELVGERTRLRVITEETLTLDPSFEGTFSVFALDREVKDLTIGGMQYTLDQGTLSYAFPLGVSNHVKAGEGAFVSAGQGLALVVLIQGA